MYICIYTLGIFRQLPLIPLIGEFLGAFDFQYMSCTIQAVLYE